MLFACLRRNPLNQALRQVELGAKLALTTSHFAGVGFVIVASEVEQAVKDENLDLGREGMALLDGLLARSGHRDGQVAGYIFCSKPFGRKGKHIGRFVHAAKLAVELANGCAGGEQDGHFTFEANGCLRQAKKAGKRTGRRQA
jgi:hypothetical protein